MERVEYDEKGEIVEGYTFYRIESKGDLKEIKPEDILLVDDDAGPLDYFANALAHITERKVYHLMSANMALDCMDALHAASIQPSLVVQDIMMPPPREESRKSGFDYDDGLNTGVALIEAWQEKFHDLLIVCLTNRSDDSTKADSAPSLFTANKISSVPIKYKYKISPNDFGIYVAELLAKKA